MSDLKTSFRFHRQMKRSPQDALARAREDVAQNVTRYPSETSGMSGGRAFKAYGEAQMMWFEKPDAYMRFVGTSDQIVKLRHTGWHMDEDGFESVHGVVYQLPSRKGKLQFLYGFADPYNDGPVCLSLSIADDKEDAARWADQVAERVAEETREYNIVWQSGERYRELADVISRARADCLKLIRETKAACNSIREYESIKATIRAAILRKRRTIADARDEREKLFDAFGSNPAFVDG